MHNYIMGIGAAILNYFRSIELSNLKSALSIMGVGMLGIFVVTGVIILVVSLLNKLFSKA